MVLKAHFKTAILNRVVFRNYNKVLETVLKETSNLIRTWFVRKQVAVKNLSVGYSLTSMTKTTKSLTDTLLKKEFQQIAIILSNQYYGFCFLAIAIFAKFTSLF